MINNNYTNPLDSAINAYIEHGLKIFPIKSCGSVQGGILVDKTPAFNNWQDWAKNVTAQKITEYAMAEPTTNWAVHPGHSNIVIVDVDVKGDKDGFAPLKALTDKHGTFHTLTVRTPSGGVHYYFRYGGALKGGTNKLGTGVDVQSGGKYAVLFGSEIAEGGKQSGGFYEVINDTAIAEIPAWLLKEIQEAAPNTPEVNAEGKVATPEITGVDAPENINAAGRWLREKAIPCVQGTEHGGEYLLQIFYELRDRGISKPEAMNLFTIHYNFRCEPPWDGEVDEAHLNAKLDNAYNYAQNENIGAKTDEAKFIEAKTEFESTPVIDTPRIEVNVSPETLGDDDKDPINARDFTGDPPDREWLIRDWIPKNEISSLYGSGGSGKSLMSLQLAMSVSLGVDFLGLQVEEQMPVIAVYCEDSEDELHRRFVAVKDTPEFEFNKKHGKDLMLWPRVGMTNDLARLSNSGNDIVSGPFRKRLEKYLDSLDKGPKLLILDTLSDIYLGDENVRERVNKFVKTHLGSLVIKYELTILVLAHPSRTGQNTKDMLSGSTAWENSVRNRLAFMPHKELEEVMVLKRMKSNYAKKGEEVCVEWFNGKFRVADANEMSVNAMTMEQKDVLEAIALTYKAPSTVNVHAAAQNFLTLERFAHLFGGMSFSAVERSIEKALQYTRTMAGAHYYYTEGKIDGRRGTRWIVVEEAAETRKELTEALENGELNALETEEAYIDAVDDNSFMN